MATALIALGGNIGDVRSTLAQAVAAFCDGEAVRLVARSADYETPPWGVTDQPAFVNLCLVVETTLAPHALLRRALAVERELGRNRLTGRRWGPRPVDIDLIAYDDLRIADDALILPHPRAAERAFVLVPLMEIAPERRIGDATVATLAGRLDLAARDACRRLPDVDGAMAEPAARPVSSGR